MSSDECVDKVVYMVKTAAATKAPNRATVEESWMTAEELLSVFDGPRGLVVFDGYVV